MTKRRKAAAFTVLFALGGVFVVASNAWHAPGRTMPTLVGMVCLIGAFLFAFLWMRIKYSTWDPGEANDVETTTPAAPRSWSDRGLPQRVALAAVPILFIFSPLREAWLFFMSLVAGGLAGLSAAIGIFHPKDRA
ncbi:MAG: hypothetical protein U0R80_10620 [Nocardioidaceae bacterium]